MATAAQYRLSSRIVKKSVGVSKDGVEDEYDVIRKLEKVELDEY